MLYYTSYSKLIYIIYICALTCWTKVPWDTLLSAVWRGPGDLTISSPIQCMANSFCSHTPHATPYKANFMLSKISASLANFMLSKCKICKLERLLNILNTSIDEINNEPKKNRCSRKAASHASQEPPSSLGHLSNLSNAVQFQTRASQCQTAKLCEHLRV